MHEQHRAEAEALGDRGPYRYSLTSFHAYLTDRTLPRTHNTHPGHTKSDRRTNTCGRHVLPRRRSTLQLTHLAPWKHYGQLYARRPRHVDECDDSCGRSVHLMWFHVVIQLLNSLNTPTPHNTHPHLYNKFPCPVRATLTNPKEVALDRLGPTPVSHSLG